MRLVSLPVAPRQTPALEPESYVIVVASKVPLERVLLPVELPLSFLVAGAGVGETLGQQPFYSESLTWLPDNVGWQRACHTSVVPENLVGAN